MKSAIYALRANPSVTQALERAAVRLNWAPCCILAEKANLQYVRKRHPGVLAIDNQLEAVDIGRIYKTLKTFYDENKRQTYGKYEMEVFKNLERILPMYRYSPADRVFFFHVWLCYWIQTLNGLKPDIVFFQNSPMMPSHFILYIVCLEQDVDTILGNNISHPDRWTNFKKIILGSPIGLEDTYALNLQAVKDGARQPCPWAVDYYERKRHLETPDYLAEKQAATARKAMHPLLDNIFDALLRQDLAFRFLYAVAYADHRLTGKNWMDAIERSRRKRLTARYYHKISSVPESLPEHYLYVPLHYQPERSTSPDAGIFADQHLIVKLLDRMIPEGWRIVVKEHPSQFAPYSEGEKGRDVSDYEQMQRLPSVRFVHERFSSHTLIQNAQAVVTCTGTAGWEAVLMNKPVLVFGRIWYDCSPGVFPVQNDEDVRCSIRSIMNGARPERLSTIVLIESIAETSFSLWDAESRAFNTQAFVDHLVVACETVMAASRPTGEKTGTLLSNCQARC